MRISRIKFIVKLITLAIVLVAFISIKESNGQAVWTNADYNKALWMTTRFYGAQRSGDNNWVLYNHLPAGVPAALTGKGFTGDVDGAYSLSGGWYDCGDHVKFGITQYYSAYMLLKGYSEFPTGYDDKYSFNYNGYNTSAAANRYTWEGTAHDPNCIPDILDEMKHECDYLILCARDNSNFYYQVGDGDNDHAQWVTAVKMQTLSVANGGQTRPVCKNPGESTQPSLVAATLALMSRMYRPYDATYADLCYTYALNAYNYAKVNLGNGDPTCTEGFYGANDAWRDDYSIMCAELSWAATDKGLTAAAASFQTEALQWPARPDKGDLGGVCVGPNAYYTFDYANDGELALYNMAKLGNAAALTEFNNRVAGNPTGSVTTGHFSAAANRNAQGIYTAYGGSWGALRYNANASFMIALYLKLNSATITAGNRTTLTNILHKDIDYIMGNNSNGRSYIVGFVPGGAGPFVSPQYPHHRNVYLRDDNPANATVLAIPTKNAQLGALVGGKRDASYNDDRSDYVNSEVCIDYNAGLVGALGYIKSVRNPVSLTCQTCSTPNIGADLSTCTGSIFPLTLTDANTPGAIPSGVTYTWKRVLPTPVTTPIGTAGASAKIRVIAAADCPSFPCKIVVVRDSTYTLPAPGTCTRTDTVTITNVIPTPDLGVDPAALCSATFYNLTPSNAAAFPGGTTWQWAVDYSGGTTYNNLSSETSTSLLNVRVAGRYRITATSGSCSSTNDDILITSNLPKPVDVCIASAGNASPSITNPGLNGTNYNWYNDAAATSLATVVSGSATNTTSINVNVAATKTYYVKDMSAVAGFVGPTAVLGGTTNWTLSASNRLLFTATANFTINSVQIPFDVYATSAGTVSIQILDNSNTVRATATSTSTTPGATGSNLLVQFNFSPGIYIDQASWGTNLKFVLSAETLNGDAKWNDNTLATNYCYPASCVSPIVTINGSEGFSGGNNDYGYFYNWNISSGSACSPLPVVVSVGGCLVTAPVSLISFYAERDNNRTILNWLTGSEVNNDYFNIERSTDGVNFEVIGNVNGKGTVNGVSIYSFADENTPFGKVYYRLAQYDYDGKSENSFIISVNNETTLGLQVAPNPFNSGIEILVRSNADSKVNVQITDLSGHSIVQLKHAANEKLLIGEELPVGVYILQVQLNENIKTVKIIKQ